MIVGGGGRKVPAGETDLIQRFREPAGLVVQ